MRILVTGGAGFIGSHLVRRLIQSGRHSVVNLDALKYSGNLENLADLADHPQYRFVHADIGDQQAVHAALVEHRIEGIINCAAETHVDRSILDPGAFARTDVVGTGILLEEARPLGLHRFLQVSTDEVYGSVEQGSSTESDRLEPRSPYSASKAGGDLLVLSYWTTYRFPVVVTRGSNTYGPNQYPEKFIPLFATNAIDGEPLPLYGDGRQCRDWLSVYDHAAGIQHVFEQGEPGAVYNVGGGNERENIVVAEQIVAALGKSRSGKIKKIFERLHRGDLVDPSHYEVFLLLCTATRQAIDHIEYWSERFTSEKGYKPLQVHVLCPIEPEISLKREPDPKIRALLEKSNYYDSRATDKHIEVGGTRDARMGVAGCALPVVLSHNSPNNSIYMLWGPESYKPFGLFPRVSRHREF